jgi:hypothetical protein
MRGRIRIVRVGEMPSSIAFYYEPSSFLRLVRDGWCDGDGPHTPESSHTVRRAAVVRVALSWTQKCPRCPVVAWKECAERSC